MKKILIAVVLTLSFLIIVKGAVAQKLVPYETLKKKILTDNRLDSVETMALKLLSGFSAGTSYGEIWIRDFNTFINGSLLVHSPDTVKEKLLMFLRIQGDNGDIVDGIIDSTKANGGYKYRYSALLPGWAAHKNTVETDQESSLLLAFEKYIQQTGDKNILNEKIGHKTARERLEDALLYILSERWSAQYGLVIGATTVDWGDVQPETGWGVSINEKTKWAIDIYDNAMFASAISAFMKFSTPSYKPREDWKSIQQKLVQQVRKHLWDSSTKKYIPHIYLNGSPFSKEFDEKKLLYSGGSICAVLAGFNSKSEVYEIYKQLNDASKKEKHATIGLTVHPPYPIEEFPNMGPYIYQNGGDWTWFGGRMINGLIQYGYPEYAYEVLIPMLDRVLINKGFYEWYDVRTGKPHGSGDFRGEAGVLLDAIHSIKKWAMSN